ncbi:MAG: RNA polymerase sigma factor SigB, partial [uncultured Solirubrobacterales bacterium]
WLSPHPPLRPPWSSRPPVRIAACCCATTAMATSGRGTNSSCASSRWPGSSPAATSAGPSRSTTSFRWPASDWSRPSTASTRCGPPRSRATRCPPWS